MIGCNSDVPQSDNDDCIPLQKFLKITTSKSIPIIQHNKKMDTIASPQGGNYARISHQFFFPLYGTVAVTLIRLSSCPTYPKSGQVGDIVRGLIS